MDSIIDLTKIEVSSQKNLVGCLIDGSPETFWESGDEVSKRSAILNLNVSGHGTL
jgi:hypothetical protein